MHFPKKNRVIFQGGMGSLVDGSNEIPPQTKEQDRVILSGSF